MEKLIILYATLLCAINFIKSAEVGIKTLQNSYTNGKVIVAPYYNYDNASVDAQQLYNAMTGLGTDEDIIINILTNRTNNERQLIVKAYSDSFGKDLLDDLKSDSSGNFKTVVKALVLGPEVFLARRLKKSLHTLLISDNKPIIEILCTRHEEDLKPIIKAYEKLTNSTLKNDIDEHLDGEAEAFLKYIVTEKLRKSGETNTGISYDQVGLIPNTADFCTVKQNPRLADFLAKESFEQIALVEILHEKMKSKTVQQQLKRWCPEGLLLDAYDTVVRYARDPIKYYAEELYKAMEGIGTDDDKLIRIIATRSGIDLFNIKHKYQELYNSTLVSSVKSETSGDYENILVKLIDQSDHTGVSHSYYG